MARKELTNAIAYFRTSSAANVGADKDTLPRQRAAVEAFAKAAGYELIAEYRDDGCERLGSGRPAARVRLHARAHREQRRPHHHRARRPHVSLAT